MHSILTYSSLVIIGLSGLLIISGVGLILTGHRELHKKAMLSASAFAAVFVVLYLVKSALYEPRGYTGDHRGLYLFVLLSHTVLAALNLPLAVYTVYLGLKDRIETHRKVAPITACVWLYVASSGWAIFFFLR